jgi:hypothetical protein
MPCPKGFRCPPDCTCGKHQRTAFHNLLISRGVKRAWADGCYDHLVNGNPGTEWKGTTP